MYTKMNFLCTKLRIMSTKGKKNQVIISEVVVVIKIVVANHYRNNYFNSGRYVNSGCNTRDTHTFCRAFSSGAVTTYFYD